MAKNGWKLSKVAIARPLLAKNGRWVLANQIRPTTLSAAIVFRYIRFWPKKHRVLPFLVIALYLSLPNTITTAILHYVRVQPVPGRNLPLRCTLTLIAMQCTSALLSLQQYILTVCSIAGTVPDLFYVVYYYYLLFNYMLYGHTNN